MSYKTFIYSIKLFDMLGSRRDYDIITLRETKNGGIFMNRLVQFIKQKYMHILFFIYIILSISTLTRFPFIHSDESWLSGLTRNILEKKSFSVTETFFDLKIRNPHAIKILFHSIQLVFIKIMGYDIFTFRFISLAFGMASLFLIYKIALLMFNSKPWAFFAAALLAVDVQFVYASHFARQEIIILFTLCFALWFMLSRKATAGLKDDIILGIIIGLSIGIHPNSFIIALPFGLIYLLSTLTKQKYSIKNLATFTLTTAAFAIFFIILSFKFDPNFIHNYSSYGNEFDVFNPITSKVAQMKDFYIKLYYGVSGTYYTPNIKLQFFLFPTVFFISLIKLYHEKDRRVKFSIAGILLSIIAINAGIIIVGRYNQTSVLFLFPLFYLLFIYAIQSLTRLQQIMSMNALLLALILSTWLNYLPYRENSYEDYLKNISKLISSYDNVLANLNADYYFQNGKLHDFRNLAYLKDRHISFQEYIKRNDIKYIIYPEEMDFIYESTPKWDVIYGEPNYYDEMKKFMEDHCEKIYEFTDSFYGIRIVRYINTKPWFIKIYKVTN